MNDEQRWRLGREQRREWWRRREQTSGQEAEGYESAQGSVDAWPVHSAGLNGSEGIVL
jgi:hypothetical protein